MARIISVIFSAAVAVTVLLEISEADAHALAQRYDLPLPLGYYLLASGTAVAVSFVILALFMWRRSLASWRDFDTRPLARGRLHSAIVVPGQIIAVGILAVVIAAGLFGNQSTFKNIAPVTVWVIWWVGLSLVSAFVGNLWALFNPWAAIHDLAEKMTSRWIGRNLSWRLRYPAWLASWPACAFFVLFAWFELVADGRDVPRNIAVAVAIYSAITWVGFGAFGRDPWLKSGEVFSVAFGLFGRFAPLHFVRNSHWEWRLRPPAAGLLTREPLSPSMTAFTLLMLGTVTVDGLMETPLWAVISEQLLRGNAAEKATLYMLLASLLLIAGPLLLAGLYLGVIFLMTQIRTSLNFSAIAGVFVLSLVPISIAYHLSHYFSLLAIAGQFVIPLASDPFGYGWDLFGTALYRIDIGIVDAKFIWYLCIIAVVTGHIIAVFVAHLTAFAVYSNDTVARRSQYPMLVLMIGYTTFSLWILAQPIVEFRPAN